MTKGLVHRFTVMAAMCTILGWMFDDTMMVTHCEVDRMFVGWLHSQELPRMLNTLNFLALALAHSHSLTLLLIETLSTGLGQYKHTQKDDENCLVHSQ